MSRTERSLLLLAIEPKTSGDGERLRTGLQKLLAEDPTLRANTDTQTGQTIISAQGERQLEVIVDRLKREFSVEAFVAKPQVAYKEALTAAAEGDGRFVRQTGGRGQYGHAKIRVAPLPPGTGYQFENQVVGGSVPEEYIEPVDEGIREALRRGVLTGYPIEDVRVELYDGSYHDVDSSEVAFRIAGAMALQAAAKNAKPVLLEPVMHVHVVVPKEYLRDVIVDLSSRRGQMQSQEDRGDAQTITACVPLAEMLGYGSDLRSQTHSRATYSMHFERYEPCPLGDDRDIGGDSMVGAPRWPRPAPRSSATALPEPDTDISST